MIDFGFSEVAASDALLDADIPQLLASLAVAVGPERPVTAAVDVLSACLVGAALPRLQMTAFSAATQTAINENDELLEQLQAAVMAQCGVGDVELVTLERVTRGKIITIAASVASSFASKLAPAGLGGMALNVRYLQKQGVDHPVAVWGVGLNTIAGLAGHVGRPHPAEPRDPTCPSDDHREADPGARARLRRCRRRAPQTRQGGDAARRVDGPHVRVPRHALLQRASVRRRARFRHRGRRVPGRLGGGPVAAGLDNSVAVPAVFLYRLFTFWIPVLPGWLSFTWLQRNNYV
jgi:hypothetical protein